MILLLFYSFVSGLLTVLAPCVLPLVPAVLSGSLTSDTAPMKRLVLIVLSMVISIIFFSVALRSAIAFLPFEALEYMPYVSGGLLIFLGLTFIFPQIWWKMSSWLGFGKSSNETLMKAESTNGIWQPILIGVAFGPVFSACSPMYLAILSTVLVASLSEGIIALTAYALGVGVMLFVIGLAGQKLVHKLKWATNPHGTFRRVMGVILIIVGVLYITGFDKALETLTVQLGLGSTGVDNFFLEQLDL